MTQPVKILVGPMTYEVFMTNELMIDGDKCEGALDLSKNAIYLLDNEQSVPYRAMVLMHEVMHAFLTQLGVEDTEGVVNMFSYAFIDLVKNNPDLISYVQEVFNDVE